MFAATFYIKIVLKETLFTAKTCMRFLFSFSPILQHQDSMDQWAMREREINSPNLDVISTFA